MSRTDVHVPLWVRERDPQWRHHFYADHDHATGPCDLADRIARPHLPWSATRCHINLINRSRNICCGCHQCTGQRGRRYQNGQRRAAWRTDRQRLLAGLDERPGKRIASWF